MRASSRPQSRTSHPPRESQGQCRAPCACANHWRPSCSCQSSSCFTRVRPALRVAHRVASAPARQNQAHLIAQASGARFPPRRPSRHCRCRARQGARRGANPIGRCSVARPAGSPGSHPHRPPQPKRSERQSRAGTADARPRAINHAINNRGLKTGTQITHIAFCERRNLFCRQPNGGFEPGQRKIWLSAPSIGRGRAKRSESPPSAARSTSGPPGNPSESILATLSKASPMASSIVVPSRRYTPTASTATSCVCPPEASRSR